MVMLCYLFIFSSNQTMKSRYWLTLDESGVNGCRIDFCFHARALIIPRTLSCCKKYQYFFFLFFSGYIMSLYINDVSLLV